MSLIPKFTVRLSYSAPNKTLSSHFNPLRDRKLASSTLIVLLLDGLGHLPSTGAVKDLFAKLLR
jgi:hypothetical protein